MNVLIQKYAKPALWIALSSILFIVVLIHCVYHPVRIGILFSSDSSTAMEEDLTIRSYIKNHPRIGFRKIIIFSEHPGLSKIKIQESYRRLAKKKVSLIIGGAINDSGEPLSKEAARNGIPTFGITTSSDKVFGKKFYHSFVMNIQKNSTMAANYLNESHSGKLLILASLRMNNFSEPYAKNLSKTYTKKSKIAPFISTAQVQDIIHTFKPDTVFLLLTPVEILQSLKIIQKENLYSRVFVLNPQYEALATQFSNNLTENIFIFSEINEPDLAEISFLSNLENIYHIPFTSASRVALSSIKTIYTALNEGTELTNLQNNPPSFYIYQIIKHKKLLLKKVPIRENRI